MALGSGEKNEADRAQEGAAPGISNQRPFLTGTAWSLGHLGLGL
jgi:hypothetical protein